ncbi:MAG: hypothetical protein ACC652_03895 [Acidimicrobiales bacterium]
MTISNDDVGSRMSAFSFDGTLVAESVPIGQGGAGRRSARSRRSAWWRV